METLFAGASPPALELTPVKNTAPPIRAPATTIANAVDFIQVSILEVEYGRHEARGDQTVNDVEDAEHDDNQPRGFKEDARLGAVVDTEGAEADEGEHRQRAKSKGEHSQASRQKAPRAERVELHRLRKAARQKEGGDADQQGSQRVIDLRYAHGVFGNKFRHRGLEPLSKVEDVEQVDTEHQHHQADDEPEHKGRRDAERKRRPERPDDAAEDKKGYDAPRVEEQLRLDAVALSGKGRRHRQQQPADHRHAGGKRGDDADDKRGPVGDAAAADQVDKTDFLQDKKQHPKRQRNRRRDGKVRPFDALLLGLCRELVTVHLEQQRELLRYVGLAFAAEVSAALHATRLQVGDGVDPKSTPLKY